MHDSIFSLLETVTNPYVLSQTQHLVLQQIWEGRTYAHIAEDSGYSLDYIKTIGSELCHWLSEVFGEPVNKRNLKAIVSAGVRQHYASPPSYLPNHQPDVAIAPATDLPVDRLAHRQDWGEAIDTHNFVGRTVEQEQLKTLLLEDRCRLVSVFGMAGVGKTALTIHSAEQLQDQFEFVIWRSLRNAPDITALLDDLLQFLSRGQATDLPTSCHHRLRLLLTYLQQHRCLILLDNWESVLASCAEPTEAACGCYRPGFEGYGHLLRIVSENRHQSCLMMTSRELPIGLAAQESTSSAIHVLKLQGLQPTDATALVSRMHLAGSATAWEQLIHHYSSNSLALKIAAVVIRDLFDRNIDRFLKQNVLMFGEISHFLAQQLDRLPRQELQLLQRLADYPQGITLEQLQHSTSNSLPTGRLLELLHRLQRRALLDCHGDRFMLPCILKTHFISLEDKNLPLVS